jgi:hypothetical protein
MVCRLAKPKSRPFVIFRNACAVLIGPTEKKLRDCMILIGGFAIPKSSLILVIQRVTVCVSFTNTEL